MTPEDAGTFHVEMIELDGHAELGLVGELDMDSAKQLAAALEAVYEHGVDTLVLDLSQLRFIDSSGLNQLVLALKHQQGRDGQVVLRAPTAQTLRVLELVGLTALFTTPEQFRQRRPTADGIGGRHPTPPRASHKRVAFETGAGSGLKGLTDASTTRGHNHRLRTGLAYRHFAPGR